MSLFTFPLAENAGVEGSLILQKVEQLPETHGYNALTGEFVDMIQAGILDPTKVTRTALENAASVAGLLITAEALVADLPSDSNAMPAGMGGMGGMDY